MSLFSSIARRYRSVRRYNQILRVFVKYGFDDLVSYMEDQKRFAWLRKLLPKSFRKAASHYTKYEKMRLVCEELGPTFVKFGQILSNRPDLLPLDLIVQFEKLQDNVPPLSGQVARKVVETELKKSTDDLFAWFEPEPFASASMAQVHKATLKSGERVAVKIQRPGIKEVIIEDIKVMYTVAEILHRRVPSVRSFDPVGLVRNFEESILKELDFIHESVNAQRFYNNFSGTDENSRFIHAPRVYREFTTPRVLVLEFIQGFKISKLDQIKAGQFDRNQIARKLAISYLRQVFEHGFFHADPHPGNILILQTGEICYLDFGMMGSIIPKDIEVFGQLFLSVKDKDVKKIIKALMQLSDLVTIKNMRALEFDINEFVESYYVGGVHANEMSTVLLQLKDVIVKHDLKIPSHFFLLARSLVTIEGVIRNLDPKLDMLELAKPYLVSAMTKKFSPLQMGKKVLSGIFEFGNYMEEFPRDLKNAIRKINTGEIKVDLRHKGIDPLIHTINRVTKQLVAALILAALLIGGSLTLINETTPLWNDTSAWSVIAFILAGILALGMLRDMRKGDHDPWQGWKD
ncbi:MAG: AarF/ABC1/UbiB kinase family protein [Bacteroidetes bacterium]|nr:AarF/ABC1/UbiB kinase family protein [Bacteroidota bacterium]